MRIDNSYAYLDDRGFEILKSIFHKSDTEPGVVYSGGYPQLYRENGRERLFVIYKSKESRELLPIDLSELIDIRDKELSKNEPEWYPNGLITREVTSIGAVGMKYAVNKFLHDANYLCKGKYKILLFVLGHTHLKSLQKDGKFFDPAKPTNPNDYGASMPGYTHAGMVLTYFKGAFKLSIYEQSQDKTGIFKVVTFK